MSRKVKCVGEEVKMASLLDIVSVKYLIYLGLCLNAAACNTVGNFSVIDPKQWVLMA